MNGYLVDSNVILDIVLDDPTWGDWSESTLADRSMDRPLYINSVIYSEVSVGFEKIEELEEVMTIGNFRFLEVPKEALFLAGKAYLAYKRRSGSKTSPRPDFFIGAHAAVLQLDLITRDRGRYSTYFPSVRLVSPDRT